MSKLTVQEYATKHQISTQAVYNKIKKGTIESIIEDNKTYVFDEVSKVQPTLKDDCNKLVKKLLKRIDKLEDKLDKEREKSEAILGSYVHEIKAMYLPAPKSKKKKK